MLSWRVAVPNSKILAGAVTLQSPLHHCDTHCSSVRLKMRKSRSRRRGPINGFEKYKIRSKPQDHQKGLIGTILNIRNLRQRLTELAVKSCTFINETAFKFCLVPLSRGESGEIIVAPWNRLVVHFIFLLLWFALTVLNLHGCILQISQGKLDLRTFLSVTMFSMLAVCMIVALSCILKPTETAQLLNGCESILECVGAVIGKKIVACDFAEVSLKVLGLNAVVWGTAVDAAVFTLIDDSLPVSLYATSRGLGISVGDGDLVAGVILKGVFLALEFASYGLPTLSAVFAGQLLVTTIGTFNACTNELRY